MTLKPHLLIGLFFLYTHFLIAQSRQEVLGSIQKLVNKTEGQKIKSDNVFAKKDDKLGKQVFNEKEISVNKIPEGKSKYEWVSRASEISWNDFFDYLIYSEYNNSNLKIVRINFNKSFKDEHFTNDKNGDSYPSTSKSFEFYILSSDTEEITKLLDRLENLKEKKVESGFNKEIAKFSKEQTISWLTETLKKHISGNDYTRGLTIVNIDECRLIFDYSNIVGRKYREIIPTDIASINKYNQFTYKKDICISKSYAFGMIQENDETTYENHSFLRINTKDENLISKIAYAMKHLAGYCNNTHTNSNTTSTVNNSIYKKKEDNNADPTTEFLDFEKTMELYNALNKIFVIDNTEYIILNTTDFANFLNKNCYAALHWQGKDNYQFDVVGKTDFSKKSLEFIVKNDKLYLKANIPLNGNCDYGLKEFEVVDADNSETLETADTKIYYLTLKFNYECNGINYSKLTIYIEDKTLSSYEKVKKLFATYGNG